jgi:hypothetical protein
MLERTTRAPRLFLSTLLTLITLSPMSFSQSWGADTLSTLQLELPNSAGYPFVCYAGRILLNGSEQFIDGKISRVYYGYTGATLEEFNANPELPWFNLDGEPRAQGVLEAKHEHDRGYKGSMRMLPLSIPAPEGRNVLIRVAYQKILAGDCFSQSEPLQTVASESRVFFVGNKKSK